MWQLVRRKWLLTCELWPPSQLDPCHWLVSGCSPIHVYVDNKAESYIADLELQVSVRSPARHCSSFRHVRREILFHGGQRWCPDLSWELYDWGEPLGRYGGKLNQFFYDVCRPLCFHDPCNDTGWFTCGPIHDNSGELRFFDIQSMFQCTSRRPDEDRAHDLAPWDWLSEAVLRTVSYRRFASHTPHSVRGGQLGAGCRGCVRRSTKADNGALNAQLSGRLSV